MVREVSPGDEVGSLRKEYTRIPAYGRAHVPVLYPAGDVFHVACGHGRDLPAHCSNSVDLAGRAASSGLSRSEEHTSELQSRQYLVCRLLLEKKKNIA